MSFGGAESGGDLSTSERARLKALEVGNLVPTEELEQFASSTKGAYQSINRLHYGEGSVYLTIADFFFVI